MQVPSLLLSRPSLSFVSKKNPILSRASAVLRRMHGSCEGTFQHAVFEPPPFA